MIVGEALRRCRQDAGLTQAALAEAAGVVRGYVVQIEHGQRQPSIEVLQRLLEATGWQLAVVRPAQDAETIVLTGGGS